MKLVTFAQSMAPYGVGDTRLVEDKVAAKLARDGMISSSEPFPPAAEKPRRPMLKPARPSGHADKRKAG